MLNIGVCVLMEEVDSFLQVPVKAAAAAARAWGRVSLVCQTQWYLELHTLGQDWKTQSALWFHNPAWWQGLFYRPADSF